MAQPGGTPLEAALQNVAQLETFRLPDDQPHVEAAAATINYVASFDTNFEDRTAFVSGISKYVEDAQSLAALVRLQRDEESQGKEIVCGATSEPIGLIVGRQKEATRSDVCLGRALKARPSLYVKSVGQ